MIKQVFVWLLATVSLTTVFPVRAQQPAKVPRIGYLSSVDRPTDLPRTEGIRHGLRVLGYIDGENISIEYRYTEGRRDRVPELAAELVRLKS